MHLAAGSTKAVPVSRAWGGTLRILFDSVRRKLYWTTGLNNQLCTLGVYDVDSGAPSTLSRDLDVYGAPAQDRDYIYWPASTSIMRMHK